MKKIFSLFLCVISLSSCTNQTLPKKESYEKESVFEVMSSKLEESILETDSAIENMPKEMSSSEGYTFKEGPDGIEREMNIGDTFIGWTLVEAKET